MLTPEEAVKIIECSNKGIYMDGVHRARALLTSMLETNYIKVPEQNPFILSPEKALEILSKDNSSTPIHPVTQALQALQAHYHNRAVERLKESHTDDLKVALIYLCGLITAFHNLSNLELVKTTTYAEKALKNYQGQHKAIEQELESRGVDITTIF